MGYQHVSTERREGVGWLWLDRADKRNALSADMWSDIPAAIEDLSADDAVRAIVVAGKGPAFTVGIDLAMLMSLQPDGRSPVDARMTIYREIKRLQATMTSFADCPKPVVAAVHGYCLGAGIDLITACDIRLAAADATFSVRETKLALVADLGTLQRLPNIVGPGHAADLVYTGRDIDAGRAEKIGLVNEVYPDTESLHDAAHKLASESASNSPLVVEGIKRILSDGDELSTEQALDHVALWNAAFLHSNDLMEAFAAYTQKRDPDFTGT